MLNCTKRVTKKEMIELQEHFHLVYRFRDARKMDFGRRYKFVTGKVLAKVYREILFNFLQSCQRKSRVGKLTFPPDMLNREKAFAEAFDNPGKKYRLCVGPYDVVISLYREFESRELKLKKGNENLRKRLGTLEKTIATLNQEKKDTDEIQIVLASKTPAPTNMEAAESSWNPRGPKKHRPNKQRHPKRSPVHKRMKTSVTGTDPLVGECFLIAAESREKVEEKRKMEMVEMRLSHFLTAQLQHMHDHG